LDIIDFFLSNLYLKVYIVDYCCVKLSWFKISQKSYFLYVEQEQLTLPEHMSSLPVFSGAWSLVFCVMFCRLLLVLSFLAIALSVLLWFTASDYTFGIFKLFLAWSFDPSQMSGSWHFSYPSTKLMLSKLLGKDIYGSIIFLQSLIKIRCLSYLFIICFSRYNRTSRLGSCQDSYFQHTNQWWAYLFKPCTRQERLSDWSIYLTVLHMIWW
jgi:hypothetical protein